MQFVAQVEFDDDTLCLELFAQAAQSLLVGVGGRADQQLLAKFVGHTLFQAHDGSLINALLSAQAEQFAQFVLWPLGHADEEAARAVRAALPVLHETVEGLPAAQVEVADAEVCAFGDFEGVLQGFEQAVFYVVEDARHGCVPFEF